MKANLWTILFAMATVSVFGACGVEETQDKPADGFKADTGDAGTGSAADKGTDSGEPATDSGTTDPTPDSGNTDAGTVTAPPANADVAASPASCTLKLSALYIGGAASGEIRGNIPGVSTWSSGPALTDADNDLYLDFVQASLPVGSFDFSYVSSDGTWALYGSKEQLRTMSAGGKSFVSCNWFDGTGEVAVDSPECHLRITIAADCTVTGAGNMANFQ